MMQHTEDFKRQAVRIALRRGLSRCRVASDLGSIFRRWASGYQSIGLLIWRQTWTPRLRTEAAIFQYINGLYNTCRRHSYMGGISLFTFEAKMA
jgi:transposase InsO family protein